jgi:hypothetical protein
VLGVVVFGVGVLGVVVFGVEAAGVVVLLLDGVVVLLLDGVVVLLLAGAAPPDGVAMDGVVAEGVVADGVVELPLPWVAGGSWLLPRSVGSRIIWPSWISVGRPSPPSNFTDT